MERLYEYQRMLIQRGVRDSNALRMFAAQLMQEDGALNENTIGDHGCSFGILQYNSCKHDGISAKRFLSLHPEWKGYRYQLQQMADERAAAYKVYHGDIARAVIDHNCPWCAEMHLDSCYANQKRLKKCYYESVTDRSTDFTI